MKKDEGEGEGEALKKEALKGRASRKGVQPLSDQTES